MNTVNRWLKVAIGQMFQFSILGNVQTKYTYFFQKYEIQFMDGD